jgi:carboxymethylenebutenolidase
MFHLAGLDERVNAGYAPYIEALEEHGKDFVVHVYEGVNHGFHNDTTPRYDEDAARLAQERTLGFFRERLAD